MAFGWLKNLFSKKNKAGKNNQIDFVHENPFYESGDNEAVNPFFHEQDDFSPQMADSKPDYSKTDAVTASAKIDSVHTEGSEEGNKKKENILEIVAGMPTKASIESMAGGLKMEKLWKHKSFLKALEALEKYQSIMSEERQSPQINAKKARIAFRKATIKSEEIYNGKAIREAFQSLGEFIVQANSAVEGANGLFSRHSSNVQKLTPIFANLIARANGILPKLAYLENAITSYIIETNAESFTYADIIEHNVTGNRSGGLVMKGIEEDTGSIDLSPDRVKKILKNKNGDTQKHMTDILGERNKETLKSRMDLKIPMLPAGILKQAASATFSDNLSKDLLNSARDIAENYLAELRPLMVALSDTMESFESFQGGKERDEVHKKQAEYFRLSRLFNRAIQQKELLVSVILNGFPESEKVDSAGYEDLIKLASLGTVSLASGVELLNKEAQDESKFIRLVDKEGKELEEDKDYIVGGGMLSVAIIDKVNKHVLRSPKDLDKDEQSTALNGIFDEAAGKISQFLGFNVMANAEAKGFFSKGDGGEKALFGGSVMDFADGREGYRINLMFGNEEDKIYEGRKNDRFQNVNVMENPRIVEDMMKMNIVDYLMMHGDRHSENFFINTNAKDGEASVTGIDNDIILGQYTGGHEHGFGNSAAALYTIHNKTSMDWGMNLNATFPMMTKGVKEALNKLDLEKFNLMLMPYADRVIRIGVVQRAKELKKLAETVPEVDLNKKEDLEAYISAIKKQSAVEWLKNITINDNDRFIALRTLPNQLIRMALQSYGTIGRVSMGYRNTANLIFSLKMLGFSYEEALQMMTENMSASSESDTGVTREEILNSDYGAPLADYDMPVEEFRKKYNIDSDLKSNVK